MTLPIHPTVLDALSVAQRRLANAMLTQPDATAKELGAALGGLSENTIKTQLRRMGKALQVSGSRCSILLTLAVGSEGVPSTVVRDQPTVPALPTSDEVMVAVNNPGAFVHRRAVRADDLAQEPMRDWQRRALEAGPLHPDGPRPPRRPIREKCTGQHTRTWCCGEHGHHVMPHRGCILR